MSAVAGQRVVYLTFTADEYEILALFADYPASYIDQAVPMLRQKFAAKVTHRPAPHPSVPGYDADDPKALALDPGFDPDWMRDRWRGK